MQNERADGCCLGKPGVSTWDETLLLGSLYDSNEPERIEAVPNAIMSRLEKIIKSGERNFLCSYF